MTRHSTRIDFSLKGKWLVRYEPAEFKYPDILLTLARIQDFSNEKNISFNSMNIVFNNKSDKNCFFREKDSIFMNFSAINNNFEEISAKPCELATLEPLQKQVKSISLLFPRLDSDPRWKTMGLPAAHLFLGSGLQAAGFKASSIPLSLPAAELRPETLVADMAGLTIFEDLLPSLRPFLARFRAVYNGWLAAGGPFPSLAPMAAAYHLPQVNLFVRGEAELAWPGILDALNRGDALALFKHKGCFWQQPSLIVMADFDLVNRPETFNRFQVDFDFLQAQHLEHGLEMNFSRGCGRGCIFCCRAQGTKFRKLPIEKAAELVKAYTDKLPLSAAGGPAWTVNINDDDILQEPAYAQEIFTMLKENGLRIFGVQTSIASLVSSDGSPKPDVLDLVADPGLFVENSPLLWLGTDVFLLERARRLGKKLPSRDKFASLLAEMEKRGLRHFHYWISSDGDSTWEEFVEELAIIFGCFRDFPAFSLLAHAPFIVPYPASRLFSTIALDDPRLKVKLALDAPDSRFAYRVIDRLETHWPQLNDLLKNDKAGGEKGFFDFLKEKDLMAAAQLAYHFLKQEGLQNSGTEPSLTLAFKRLDKIIGNLLEHRK